MIKSEGGRRTRRRAGCSRASAAPGEARGPVVMAVGRRDKHETKSVPAKLPWQLWERRARRCHGESHLVFSRCDRRLGKDFRR